MASVPRTIQYRLAEFNSPGKTETLKSRLDRARETARLAVNRKEPAGIDEGSFRFINEFITHAGLIYGRLLSYTEGADQLAIHISNTAESLDLAPLQADPGKEILKNMLYFGVVENHVLVIQSPGLKAQHLEQYLNWLLRETEVHSLKDQLFLSDPVKLELRKKPLDPVKVEFFAPMHFSDEAGTDVDQVESASTVVKPDSKLMAMLKAMLGKNFPGLRKGVKVQDLHNSRLKARLTLQWTNTQQMPEHNFLDAITRNTRHLDDEIGFKITTKSGTITREQLRLSKKYLFEATNKIPHLDAVRERMVEYLNLLNSNKEVVQYPAES